MKKLSRFLKPYKGSVILLILATFLQTFGQLLSPHFTANIINNGIIAGDLDYIRQTGFIMVLVVFAAGAFSILAVYLSSKLGASLARDLRAAVFKKAGGYSVTQFKEVGTASMITRNTNDITQVTMLFVFGAQFFLPGPLLAIGAFILALYRDITLTMILLGTVIIIAIVASFIIFKSVPLFMKLQPKMDKINKIMREIVVGVRVIRAFNKEDDEKSKLSSVASNYENLSIKINNAFAPFMPLMVFIVSFANILLIWFGGIRVSYGYTEIGNITAIMEYSMHIMMAVMMLSFVLFYIPRAEVSARRINEVLDRVAKEETGIEEIDETINTLEFKSVSFSYPDAAEAVLKNINFTAKKGDVVAIIGSTGSGKSTVVNLIPRFYEPTSGEIFVNGKNMANLDPKKLRKKIGFVSQKPIIFSGTVDENINFGNDASLDEVEKALELAQAKTFIDEKENGLLERVSQSGTNFSGGQKQRLSIARAIARNPEIYVFDDSFSALDYKTDRQLRESLKNVIKESIFIIVAQRVSTIKNATKIIILHEGEIEAQGTHKELMETNERYKQIVLSQLDEQEVFA